MNLSERVIIHMIQLAIEKNKAKEVFDIIKPFIDSTDDLDLYTTCKVESIVNEDIVIIPTKQEIRKIKLQKIDQLFEKQEEMIYDANRIKTFIENYLKQE